MNEIGSEFHKMPFENGCGMKTPLNGEYVFSGRTAIETILKNISIKKKALLPSYCCESMIDPFIKSGFVVEFYKVEYNNGLCIDLDIPADVNVLLWCNYFGFNTTMPELSSFIERGGIIIEDITHSLFSRIKYNEQSHYICASIRKWEPIICGGYCASLHGHLNYYPTNIPSNEFISIKQGAMNIKSEYLLDENETNKARYLSMYKYANTWLEENYSEKTIDSYSYHFLESIDMEKQRNIRRNNARALYYTLKNKVHFLFQEDQMDCPLFVPILIFENRNALRNRLINKRIYCPVHWPRPSQCNSNLYDIELSLICDQRYTEDDMERYGFELAKML